MNKEKIAQNIIERFIRYVQIDTQSDPKSNTYPSTEKQKNLSALLVKELNEMSVAAEMDEYGYVYASIPSNSTKKNVPAICLCAHVDTSPDCSGANVKPIVHYGFNGNDIILPDDNTQIISIDKFPYLKNHIGSDIITASGKTLLGADDKAGVAIIMQTVHTIITNPNIIHGNLKILFTPDEEVGKGTAKVDINKINAYACYTLDGGEAGSLEDETFSADAVKIIIHGVSAHPGFAKNKLINSLKIASKIIDELPVNGWSPETTEGKEGFVHPVSIEGIAEKTIIDFIVRDFDTLKLKEHEAKLKSIAKNVIKDYPQCKMEFIVTEQYRNMKEVLENFPDVVQNAKEAIERAGLQVDIQSIRGGTDGSKLSFMGLPCPNIFAGEQGIHSKLEWVAVNDLVKGVETCIHLLQIWEEKAD